MQAEGLVKRYRAGGEEVRALDHVDLAIARGDFVVIAGRSGSGKTTLLNLLGALDAPDAGKLVVAGMDLVQADEAARAHFRLWRVGFVFQAYNLIRALSAWENAAFVLELRGVPKKERKKIAFAMLARVGLAGMEMRRADELSGGQQQRVAVARALAAKPELVLADEPTANLDRGNAESLVRLMRQLNEEEGITFILASHDPTVMAEARTLITLEDGRIVATESR